MTAAGSAPGPDDPGLAARALAEAGISLSFSGRVTGTPVVLGAAAAILAGLEARGRA